SCTVSTLNGETLKIYDARKHPVRTIGEVKGKPGEVVAVGADSFHVTAQGGRIEILIVRLESGGKMPAGEFARAKALAVARAPGEVVLAGDTTIALGRRILGKA
ncbi:hypothetical protein, partial [Escherichia coli]|uniref:hypothetical protein n=1 Tax=Escherichia coli TaxID=562 RepID=UPI003D3624CB